MTRRREFRTPRGGAAAAWLRAVYAQEPVKRKSLGFLDTASLSAWDQWTAAFMQRLRELTGPRAETSQSRFAGRTGAPNALPRSRPSSSDSRSMSFSPRGPRLLRQKRSHRLSRSCSRSAGIRLGLTTLRTLGDPTATSPAYRRSQQILLVSASNSCARLSRVSAGWRSWPTLDIPPACWKWVRFRQLPARLICRLQCWKSEQ